MKHGEIDKICLGTEPGYTIHKENGSMTSDLLRYEDVNPDRQ